MRRSYEYPAKHQNGSDYYSHVQRMARAPSVLTDVPHYSHGQRQPFFNFNNQANANLREDYGHYDHQQKRLIRDDYGGYYEHQQQQHNTPEVHKTVEVTERVTQCDSNGNCVEFEEKVNAEADGYIQEKHKGFELCKWRTFKTR